MRVVSLGLMMDISNHHDFTELSWRNYEIHFRIVFGITSYQFGVSYIKASKCNFVKYPILLIHH